MSEMKHTPGPWHLFEDDGATNPEGFNVCAKPERNAPFIADVIGGLGPERTKANARLIAAAPDLYEALWAILYADQDNQIENDLFQQAKAALDKAKGEQS